MTSWLNGLALGAVVVATGYVAVYAARQLGWRGFTGQAAQQRAAGGPSAPTCGRACDGCAKAKSAAGPSV